MTIHPEDFDKLTALLGTPDVPEEVEKEYTLCRAMYHALGGSGAIPVAMTVDLLRRLDIIPARLIKAPQENIDWRRLPSDGTVRVEVYERSEWKPGVYCGVLEFGVLCVRLDGEVEMKEFSRLSVRLAQEKIVLPTQNKQENRRGRTATVA